MNILVIVIVRLIPTKKSSNLLLDFTYNLLTLFTKLVIFITKIKEFSPSEDWVDVSVIVVVVIVSSVSHQAKVSQGFDIN